MANQLSLSQPPKFHIPEGFARIARDSMDDCGDDSKGVGQTLFVRETDQIEHLGGLREYFEPISTIEPWKVAVVRLFNRSVGLLPIVRAYETLKTLRRIPTIEEIQHAAQESLADYHMRRLLLGVGGRGQQLYEV